MSTLNLIKSPDRLRICFKNTSEMQSVVRHTCNLSITREDVEMRSQPTSDLPNQNLHFNHPEVIRMHVKVCSAVQDK